MNNKKPTISATAKNVIKNSGFSMITCWPYHGPIVAVGPVVGVAATIFFSLCFGVENNLTGNPRDIG